MFSNTLALDVVIGLVLIYFIYSLLVSIIGEMLSGWMGIRARLLRQGIGSLLNDQRSGVLKLDLPHWLKDSFLVEPKNFKYSNAGRFYKEPGIRKLAKRGDEKAWYSIRNTKPSYISKELYARTLLNMFGRKGRGICEKDRVFMAVETNAIHLEPETQRRYHEMLVASNGDLPLFTTFLEDEFSEMMDRVTGWYKRKLGFILFWVGFLICMALNVDTFEIVNILVKNPKARQEMVKLAQDAVKDGADGAAWSQVSPDSATYIALLESSYTKAFRDAREAEFLLAQGWNFKGVSESTKIEQKDSTRVAKLLILSNKLQPELVRQKKGIDTSDFKAPELKDKIAEYYHSVQDYRAKVLDPLGAVLGKKIFSIGSTSLAKDNILIATIEPGTGEKVLAVMCLTLPWTIKFWGLVLSALALSLGSNFWFDLLKRLVAIRSAGVKPEEKPVEKNENDPVAKKKIDGTHVEINDPIEKAISENRKTWESIPGVVAINRAVLEVGGSKREGIKLIVEERIFVNSSVPKSLDLVIDGAPLKVPIITIFGKAGVFADDFKPKSGHIYHPLTKQYGTPAGIVRNKRTDSDAILTCAHVSILTASAFLVTDKERVDFVQNSSGNVISNIGSVKNRIFSSYLDAAVIDVTDGFDISAIKIAGSIIPKLSTPGLVTANDQGELELTVHTVSGPKKGILSHARTNYQFRDGQRSAYFYDLIKFRKGSDFDEFLTNPGDSGALITAGDIPVAILIGAADTGEGKFSFGIKLTDIMEALQLTIV